MYYIGIDPGKKGAIAVLGDMATDIEQRNNDAIAALVVRDAAATLSSCDNTAAVVDMPDDFADVWRAIVGLAMPFAERGRDDLPSRWSVRVTIELPVWVGPQRGAAYSVQTQELGRLEGMFAMRDIPVTTVNPRTWQKTLHASKGQTKEVSVGLARLLWPHVDLYGPRGGVRDGRADALHIAGYGRTMYQREQGEQADGNTSEH